MIEFLAAVALAFSARPTVVSCETPWMAGRDIGAYIVDYGQLQPPEMHLRMTTCRALRKPRPDWENVEWFTHELIHVRFPYVKHGRQMDRAVVRSMPQVCLLLNVRCPRLPWRPVPEPEPRP